jgi:hypothetical protein
MRVGKRLTVDFYKAWPHKPWKFDAAGFHVRAYGTVQITWSSK